MTAKLISGKPHDSLLRHLVNFFFFFSYSLLFPCTTAHKTCNSHTCFSCVSFLPQNILFVSLKYFLYVWRSLSMLVAFLLNLYDFYIGGELSLYVIPFSCALCGVYSSKKITNVFSLHLFINIYLDNLISHIKSLLRSSCITR